MKFLIDEQLPALLAEWLCSRDHDAIHVSALLTNTRIPDGYICERSMAEQRVVITKDVDFKDATEEDIVQVIVKNRYNKQHV